MKPEEKDLLFKDLCARLPYNVRCLHKEDDGEDYIDTIIGFDGCRFEIEEQFYDIEDFKPYLRSMSSMTEEEREELLNLLFDKESKNFYIDEEGFIDGKTSDLMKDGLSYPSFCPINIVLYTDWLNAHHFDYRGLIEKGLAIVAPEGMYET